MMTRLVRLLAVAAALAFVCSLAYAETVKVFFVKDGAVGAVERTVPDGVDNERFAFEQLAQGPTAEEFAAGWRSEMPWGVTLAPPSANAGGRRSGPTQTANPTPTPTPNPTPNPNAGARRTGLSLNFVGEGLKRERSREQESLLAAQIARTGVQFDRVWSLRVRFNDEGFRNLQRPTAEALPIQTQPLPWTAKSLGHLKQVHKDGTVSYTALGALLGKRVAISPGHGWTKTATGWGLQRGYWQGIVEDFLNPEFMIYLRQYLEEAGARVIPVRELDKNAGKGVSGYPKWQEAAKYYAESQGAPKWAYQPQNGEEGSDICSRGLYSAWRGADILVTLHNNGAKQSGTETLFEKGNGFQIDNERLANAVHKRVIDTVRKEFYPKWVDRKVQGFFGNYGENNWSLQPSALIEVAFMDTPEPDNRLLHDENFKKAVARAMYEGICDYFDRDPTYKLPNYEAK